MKNIAMKHVLVAMRRVGLVVLVVAIGFVALVANEEFHIRATFRALDQAGYGDKTSKRARHSHCQFGETTFAFIAQGGRAEHETSGYVCTGYFGPASIHDGPLDPDEDLDWD
ncbi:MAG: hypothetical protein J2P54_24100 [Bradyrhizobiaceae bacterium]|nr:hypothetical protein [Bradyrhizobiaceae bacterium]